MGKSVLITGCSEGTIGNALALEFAHRGWDVYATARTVSKMANLQSKSNVKTLALDVTDSKSVFAARAQIAKEQGGKLDMLYLNAGVRSMSMAIDYSESELAEARKAGEEEPYLRSDDTWMMEGNVTTVMAMVRAFSKLLIASKGVIAISGSGASRAPTPGTSTYNASKAAVEMYARILRLELAPLSINVVYVMTGAVATPMNLQNMTFTPDSPYAKIGDKIVAAWAGTAKDGTPWSISEYSRYVIDRLDKASPPKEIWAGAEMGTLYWVEKFNLGWLLDRMMASRFGVA
jgi:1-acylglycerone phosphate reductase